MDGKKSADSQLDKLAFEAAMEQLAAVTRQLESGEGTLEEMIGLYEQGMALVQVCNKRLDAYEAKITKLSGTEEEVQK